MRRAIVLSGGGVKGYALLGALSVLGTDADVYIGTSIGAVLAGQLALNQTIPDVWTKWGVMYPQLLAPGVNSIVSSETMERLSRELFGELTFAELYASTEKDLVVGTWCVSDSHTTHFDRETTPDVSVAAAVRASCSVPWPVLEPVVINDKEYIDGGVCNNYPVDYVLDRELEGFGVCTFTNASIARPITHDWLQYAVALTTLPREEIDRLHIKHYSQQISTTSIVTNSSDPQQLYREGALAAR